MTVPSLKNAADLQRIIKETTGREVTIVQVYKVWHLLQKILLCTSLWAGKQPRFQSEQLPLFEKVR
jgi:hypothetical protein